MKKKLLSVLMAGVLVASSSVNAFADGKVITGEDTTTLETDVTIKGNVANQSGDTLAGTISVTVPTAATFNVNKDGNFTGTQLEVTNSGEQEIDIFAYEFIDTNAEDGIKVMKSSELSSENRTRIALRLEGNRGTAHFATVRGNSNGVYSDAEHQNAGDSTGVKIARLSKGENYALDLKGEAGASQEAVNKAEQDTFTLKLKIKKASDK